MIVRKSFIHQSKEHKKLYKSMTGFFFTSSPLFMKSVFVPYFLSFVFPLISKSPIIIIINDNKKRSHHIQDTPVVSIVHKNKDDRRSFEGEDRVLRTAIFFTLICRRPIDYATDRHFLYAIYISYSPL